jgi:chromosome segregation ATPase
MIFKAIKLGSLVTGGALLTGGLIFGNELASYVRSSAHSVRTAVRDNIPMDFEIHRARDLLDEIGPEMHQNVRAIAEQEVEVVTLQRDIGESKLAIGDERTRVSKLRDAVAGGQTSFTFGDMSFSHSQMAQELSRRFMHLKEAEVAIASKQQLLENRQKSLIAAQDALENAKSQKAMLEAQVEGLEAQYKLVQAESQSAPTPVQFDHSKLAQAKQAIGDIRKQLDVAERVLAHEAKFAQSLPPDVVDEKDLLTQVDKHLGDGTVAAK